MLKLYVDAKIRLKHSAQTISQRIENRDEESGFVSAETIALAVAGVLIVGIVFGIFKSSITSAVNGMFKSITDWGGTSGTTPTSPTGS